MNRYLDQERADFLQAKVGISSKTANLAAWPRETKELPAVELDIDWVRLSTLNHRTKAEQMREIQRSENKALFSDNPLGELAQEAQSNILKNQFGFNEMKSDLAERGQQEPAVVTCEGVLINGNRRAAALRSLLHDDQNLSARYIRCLVLPQDATADELLALETELQIARDFKEEYSWVNEALLIEELYEKHDRDFSMVAKIMHRDHRHVRDNYEKIQQLNQLVELANGAYLHVDFEDNESAFKELAQHVRNRDETEKRGVRATYFLGTLAGVNYRDLRNLRRSDAAELVEQELRGQVALEGFLDSIFESAPTESDEDELLNNVLGEARTQPLVQTVLDHLAIKEGTEEIQLVDGTPLSVAEAYDLVGAAIEKASHEAKEQKKDEEAVKAPTKRLKNAADNIQRAIDTLDKARALPDWDESKFLNEVHLVRERLDELESMN